MTTKKLIQLRQLVKELKKEWKPCKEFCFNCGSCLAAQLLKEFESFVCDWLENDEIIEKRIMDYDSNFISPIIP